MRARLKTDIPCGTQAYRLKSGTEVEVEDTTEGEFRDGLRRYTIIKPVNLVCRLTLNELEIPEWARATRFASDKCGKDQME